MHVDTKMSPYCEKAFACPAGLWMPLGAGIRWSTARAVTDGNGAGARLLTHVCVRDKLCEINRLQAVSVEAVT